MKVSSELAQDRRAWSASIRDVVNSIGYAGSIRRGRMPTQIQVGVQRAESTNQWYVRSYSTVSKRGKYEQPAKGCWLPLTETFFAAFYP